MGMKLRSRIAASLLIVGAALHGMAHAQAPAHEEGNGAAFRPWAGSLGVRFHSEGLFDEASPASPLFPGGRGAASELPGQADAAGLHGLGIVGDWHPFRNGFRLSFAMYLDANESGALGTQEPLAPGGGGAFAPLSGGDYELIPYLGVGWRMDGEELPGLDLNLDIGVFLPGESSLDGWACRSPSSAPAGCGLSSPLRGDPDGLFGSFRDFEWYPAVSLGIEYRF